MILTVTLNPLLEHRLSYTQIQFGYEHRNPKEEYKAGGKGINVSRQLNLLGAINLAFTFLGGNNGKVLKKLLADEKINFSSISTHTETRASAVIIDENEKKVTSFFGNNPQISENESEEFKNKLDKMIQNCEIVVFSGSSPCKETDSIFPFGINSANKYDKISICDTYGVHLNKCIEASPTILHNNVYEIERSLNFNLREKEDFVKFLKYAYSQNVKQAFITNGSNPAYVSNLDFIYEVKPPVVETIDSTGSGDSFVSAIAYGWTKNLPFEESLKIAVSLGAANAAKYDVCNVSIEEADFLVDKVEICNLGKKMRSIDVGSA
jgi:1-phosphofructokinase family hexose kinase